ncbi:uncharacterized protein HGUI_02728 [Hanseniaspora guilliermondii]|uniref:Sec sixty-one protein homolog n=1 Tax=Hanseniaspora guilliermondii TaxID=56406 RepID=A0A1L0B257_9ASCO|nr:uncharacterized protein HGUI_02728 [Hanseniaspora guilliermondii]
MASSPVLKKTTVTKTSLGKKLSPLSYIFYAVERSSNKSELENASFLDDKFVYLLTFITIYLLLQVVPVVGLPRDFKYDNLLNPLNFAGFDIDNKGTLIGLGLFPLVISGGLIQLLTGSNILNFDFSKRVDVYAFSNLQKLTTMLISLIITSLNVFVFDKNFDSIQLLGKAFILIQWSFAQYIIIHIVECIDQGYGFQSGIMTLALSSYASVLVENLLGVTSSNAANGKIEKTGVLFFLFNALTSTNYSWMEMFQRFFFRNDLPNFSTQLISLIVGAGIVFWFNFRYELIIKSTKMRNVQQSYPIRLFYNGIVGIWISFAFLTLVDYVVINTASLIPVQLPSGVSTLLAFAYKFVQGIFLIFLNLSISQKWTDFTGSVKSIINQFKEQDIVIHSKRDSQQELSKTVDQASQTSALLLGVVVAAAGFFGFRFQNDIVSGIVAFGSVMTLLEYVIIEMQENGKDSLIFKSLGWA